MTDQEIQALASTVADKLSAKGMEVQDFIDTTANSGWQFKLDGKTIQIPGNKVRYFVKLMFNGTSLIEL